MPLFVRPTPLAVPAYNDGSRHFDRSAMNTILQLCVLGSGSSGNSSVLKLGKTAMLIDAGFGPRTMAKRLGEAKLELNQIDAVCLTHLDRDHFQPALIRSLIEHRIRVVIHRWHLQAFEQTHGAQDLIHAKLLDVFDGHLFEPIVGLRATPFPLPHDDTGTTGFLFESDVGRVGYATDLGQVPSELIDRFAGVNLLAIESNYDPHMQLRSNRPMFLKRRIMSDKGHLANEESFDAVRRIVDLGRGGNPQKIVLLHRSIQCNCPYVVRQVFNQDPRIGPRVVLTEQHCSTRWLSVVSPS